MTKLRSVLARGCWRLFGLSRVGLVQHGVMVFLGFSTRDVADGSMPTSPKCSVNFIDTYWLPRPQQMASTAMDSCSEAKPVSAIGWSLINLK